MIAYRAEMTTVNILREYIGTEIRRCQFICWTGGKIYTRHLEPLSTLRGNFLTSCRGQAPCRYWPHDPVAYLPCCVLELNTCDGGIFFACNKCGGGKKRIRNMALNPLKERMRCNYDNTFKLVIKKKLLKIWSVNSGTCCLTPLS